MGGFKGYRKRTNDDVIDEIRWLRDDFGVQEIQFLDDNFFVSGPRVKALCKDLAENFPDMTFSVPAGTEVNALDEEMIDHLADANFYRLTMAIESANQEIQDEKIDKRVDLEKVPQLIQYAKSRGIEVRGFLMIGFPDETKESILHTADYAMSLEMDDFALSVVTPLPGTPVHDEAVERGLLTEAFDPDDIRYSVSSIKIEGMSQEEIEDVRRNTWRRHQELKRERAKSDKAVHKSFSGAAEYATAGFKKKNRVGFSGFAETDEAQVSN